MPWMPSIWPFTTSPLQESPVDHVEPEPEPEPDQVKQHSSSCGAESIGAVAETIPPLIICEGFLSAAQSVVWGNEFPRYLGVGHEQLVNQVCAQSATCSQSRGNCGVEQRYKRRRELRTNRPVVFAPIGPVSSLHDRACELFYALRGGTVDYGEEHARKHGHARWGRIYDQPLCPSWGPARAETADKVISKWLPAHFLGHSLGGPTILKLQQLLRQGFFDAALGIDTSSAHDKNSQDEFKAEDLILSITSVSSPFRGTPLVYSLGCEPIPYPKVRMFSFGDMLAKLIHIAAFLDLPFFDTHADAWHFSAKRRKAVKLSQLPGGVAPALAQNTKPDPSSVFEESATGQSAGFKGLVKQLWKSDWAGGYDCAPWDCTFAERDKDLDQDDWGLQVKLDKTRTGKTWYRSYAGAMTMPEDSPLHRGLSESKPRYQRPKTYWSLSPLTYTAHLIGHFDYSRLQPAPSFLGANMEIDEKGQEVSLSQLSSHWWENDGVVPLASQFHPLDCHPDRCRHFRGMSASLPSYKNEKSILSQRSPLSSLETDTFFHYQVDSANDQNVGSTDSLNQREDIELLLPPPATQAKENVNKSILASLKSITTIAYLTSLRAINPHNPSLITPSNPDHNSFLPNLNDSSPNSPSSRTLSSERKLQPLQNATKQVDQVLNNAMANHRQNDSHDDTHQYELLNPQENQWYVFHLDNVDHTSLCPFWTGSEVQKHFWTGIGFFLASVDTKAGYARFEPSSSTSSSTTPHFDREDARFV